MFQIESKNIDFWFLIWTSSSEENLFGSADTAERKNCNAVKICINRFFQTGNETVPVLLGEITDKNAVLLSSAIITANLTNFSSPPIIRYIICYHPQHETLINSSYGIRKNASASPSISQSSVIMT